MVVIIILIYSPIISESSVDLPYNRRIITVNIIMIAKMKYVSQ